MNDRYLYRAKRIDSGEWVEGNLITDEHNPNICFIGYLFAMDESGNVHDTDIAKVDTSTICQCTGFKDDDGNKIFEGDIVGYIDCTITENGYSELYCRGLVEWDEETASFQVTERLSAESYEVLDRGCNILGNIFDSIELLEVE